MSKYLPNISISIVSHLQGSLVFALLKDIERLQVTMLEVIITINQSEILTFSEGDFSFPIIVIENEQPKGFATNHNAAFRRSTGQYFCVMNPDLELRMDPFPALLSCLQNISVGVAAPLVLNQHGDVEDSARKFPTPFKIVCKLFGKCLGNDYEISDELIHPDWVAGMFLLFPRTIFVSLSGFNQNYFLYYEDVEVCCRLRLLGKDVVLCPTAQVIHNAQRTSRRDLRYFRWHLASMIRFFASPVFWRWQWRKLL